MDPVKSSDGGIKRFLTSVVYKDVNFARKNIFVKEKLDLI